MICEPRAPEDLNNRDPWDELSFQEYSVEIDEGATNKRKIVENYLFTEESCIRRRVSDKEAMNALEILCGICITHYNKLRDSYKEIYQELKKVDVTKRVKMLKLTEKKKYLEEYSYLDEHDFIELNLAE